MNRFIQKIKKDNLITSVGIISAGIGNRIKSNEPRCLLKVGGRTLLEHQISLIKNIFASPKIIVGLGVAADKIIKKLGTEVRYVENQLYENTGSAETISHGLDLKWCQIVHLRGKELTILRQLLTKNSEEIKNMLTFEVLNLIIDKGGNIKIIEPEKISILEIDCMKDLKNEDFNK